MPREMACLFALSLSFCLEACSGSYFPRMSHSYDVDLDGFVEGWYAQQLKSLREEPLCCTAGGDTHAIRFTWLRTFHNPVVLRADRTPEGSWLLTTKVADGAGGYNPGRIKITRSREMTHEESATLLALVDTSSDFWKRPTSDDIVRPGPNDDIIVSTDGAQWIVEVREDDAYHFVEEHSPNGLIREIGLLLMEFSGEDFGRVY